MAKWFGRNGIARITRKPSHRLTVGPNNNNHAINRLFWVNFDDFLVNNLFAPAHSTCVQLSTVRPNRPSASIKTHTRRPFGQRKYYIKLMFFNYISVSRDWDAFMASIECDYIFDFAVFAFCLFFFSFFIRLLFFFGWKERKKLK